MPDHTIESVSQEQRVFPPPEEFSRAARVPSFDAYAAMYKRSIDDPEGFWRDQAKELRWSKEPTQILEWNPPFAKWFADGTLNIADNCLDRQVSGARADKTAIIWEGEPGEVVTLTYRELLAEVSKFANVLEGLGIRKGDRVGIYMGMVPEAAVAMLACARIGAIHSVVFGGFAAEAVRDRMNDAQAKCVITQDGAWRRGSVVPLKPQVDKAVDQCPTVEHVIVYERTKNEVEWKAGRDLKWSELMATASPKHTAPALPAEHPLFILYTSGTTGKPKGVMHTTAGYLLGAYLTSKYVFDLRDEDVYWCTADIGWVTGHSYIIYGPLSNGATVLMYEGAPNQPDPSRLWQIVEKHKVSVFYTAPTAIRTFVKWGDQYPGKHDLSSLRLMGSVGEPINPEAWMWYRHVIGGDRCPIVDTYWQTETGSIVMTPLPGAIPSKPGSCSLPFFGISPKVLRNDGTEAGVNEGGLLVIDKPWPSMLRTVWGDDERYKEQYFSRFPGKYFTGDGARRDADGFFWVMGRIDDVVNVSGHRLGTAEIESALVSHSAVAEAAAVGVPDPVTGQAIVVFVTLKGTEQPSATLNRALMDHVGNEIGKFARPKSIRFADAVPKTRSGKIMRRLLRDLAQGREAAGDVTTLEDISVLAKLRANEDE
jgi:acetyl-CoA synthetase